MSGPGRRPWAPLLGVGILALVLALLGRTGGAVAVVVAAVLVTQANLLSPRFVTFVEGAFAPAVARAVAAVLLLPIQVLVILPVAAAGRLLGLDPLRRIAGSGRWAARAAQRPGAGRSFADERRLGAGASNGGWRTAVAFLALGALGATVLPGLFDRSQPDVPTELQTDDGYNAMESPAMADADWAQDAAQEFFETVAEGQTYTPYVGYSLLDYAGTHVNVADRQRRTYTPAGLTPQSPDVWFFGGSTMFGFSAQRDDHTIPSEIVRLAEADRQPIRARNYGAPGYVNFQETVLLSQLLLAGGRPDVVVFYDGINDLALQLQRGFAFGEQGELGDLLTAAARTDLAGDLTGTAENATPLNPELPFADGDAAIEALDRTYAQGIELAETLADRYGFAVIHTWQPDLFSKAELAAGEQAILEPLGFDDFRFDALDRLSDQARRSLPDGVVDLGAAYDDATGPVLNDQVHTNEAGARAVAEALYPTIRDALATEGSP